MYHQNYVRFAKIHSSIKRVEVSVRNYLGENPEFGVASEWSENPRHGVPWSVAENEALRSTVKRTFNLKGSKLDFTDLAVLGWSHGRSATAVHAQLKKCRIYYTYFVEEDQCLKN